MVTTISSLFNSGCVTHLYHIFLWHLFLCFNYWDEGSSTFNTFLILTAIISVWRKKIPKTLFMKTKPLLNILIFYRSAFFLPQKQSAISSIAAEQTKAFRNEVTQNWRDVHLRILRLCAGAKSPPLITRSV